MKVVNIPEVQHLSPDEIEEMLKQFVASGFCAGYRGFMRDEDGNLHSNTFSIQLKNGVWVTGIGMHKARD
jgi:hypothetical protein